MAKKNHNEITMSDSITVRLKTKDGWTIGKHGIIRKLTKKEERLQKRNLKTKNLAGL